MLFSAICIIPDSLQRLRYRAVQYNVSLVAEVALESCERHTLGAPDSLWGLINAIPVFAMLSVSYKVVHI